MDCPIGEGCVFFLSKKVTRTRLHTPTTTTMTAIISIHSPSIAPQFTCQVWYRSVCLNFIHGDYVQIMELFIPEMGISINRRNKTLNAFITDGECYTWESSFAQSPRMSGTYILGTDAIAKFTALKSALVSVQEAKDCVATMFAGCL